MALSHPRNPPPSWASSKPSQLAGQLAQLLSHTLITNHTKAGDLLATAEHYCFAVNSTPWKMLLQRHKYDFENLQVLAEG